MVSGVLEGRWVNVNRQEALKGEWGTATSQEMLMSPQADSGPHKLEIVWQDIFYGAGELHH